ncbi:hypothetical protein IW261DRAFT_711155 [Armillaria novae-zelandiae]|uniref:Uncharacterized protein n=1 Tax=Armillaria novae-zelandiae TaxID=153914 RepID=A0AA39NX87_9AGAR|nr:hypothetical protein IW261DRAFT_711155 [Armillaria novae-zelandiae]
MTPFCTIGPPASTDWWTLKPGLGIAGIAGPPFPCHGRLCIVPAYLLRLRCHYVDPESCQRTPPKNNRLVSESAGGKRAGSTGYSLLCCSIDTSSALGLETCTYGCKLARARLQSTKAKGTEREAVPSNRTRIAFTDGSKNNRDDFFCSHTWSGSQERNRFCCPLCIIRIMKYVHSYKGLPCVPLSSQLPACFLVRPRSVSFPVLRHTLTDPFHFALRLPLDFCYSFFDVYNV